MDNQYCGYVSIIGKPNVGKSSIINAILNKKVSITSRKSQTTRNNIIGFKTESNKQMILIDTPGMHIKSQKTMNKILNKSAQSIIEDSDVILFVLQRLSIDKEDELIIEKIKDADQKIICVINKIDQIENKNKLLPFIEKLSSFKVFHEILPVSAKTKDGINQLESLIMNNLPENMHIYSQDDFVIQDDSEFMISELIREKIIRKLGDELPHDIFVEINILDKKDNVTEIHATIFVNIQLFE